MAIDPALPLKWTAASIEEQALLRNLQGNILKGHGRDYATLLFVQFKTAAGAAARAFLRAVAVEHMRDALAQLEQARAFKETGAPGDVFVGLGLSAAGYRFLRVPEARTPDDAAFRAGMKRRKDLQDPPPSKWEKGFTGLLHALVLIADDLQARVDDVRHQIEEALADTKAGKVVAREDGHAMRNKHGDSIEHFGYVDGRSQPLLLDEDIDDEKAHGGIDAWNPTVGIGAALVPDLGAPGSANFGSYLVFRKLEQNVRAFKKREKELARRLILKGKRSDLAGALAVGRFEDGTPVVLQDTDGTHPVANNFGFDGDPAGGKCPFHAHIRKTNPRGDSVRLGVSLEEERLHLMPRRGIPFGHRATHPSDPGLGDHPELMPTRGVGLLFMAYNANISRQFEFTQQSWANAPSFAGNTGLDGVIGQGKNPPGLQKWPKAWGQAGSDPSVGFDFSGFVAMKGGEYFFAPCLSFLRNL